MGRMCCCCVVGGLGFVGRFGEEGMGGRGVGGVASTVQ
jgi:hypothetical protein